MDDFRLGPIGQISRQVTDVQEAVRWYRDVLGLPHLYTFGDLAFFDCDGTRLFLTTGSAAESILYFRVPDVHAAHATLSGRGVTFEGEPHMIHRHEDGTEEWMAFFRDPDGGLLAVMSTRSPT
ncbi:VOC family protein [Dactylosporangium sp. AC04546]|uniref:VOC family protein n=1 Tax=Dactylosporangium sp. AC04546 TaxID=2862460 RepID=UPI001EDD5811|nr:VOC family protein [Dactylosporangium sp. AC04546]WVK86275.1 VOC family protein [Dactylosporangium sp. AC04546]